MTDLHNIISKSQRSADTGHRPSHLRRAIFGPSKWLV